MRHFILGFAACALFTSCASVAYNSYIMELALWEGVLRGSKPSEDIPISACKPDDISKDKCRVILIAEWERINSDVIRLKQQLKACEESRG
jgi:hypothetical protein